LTGCLRRVSSRSGIQVARQRIQVGLSHAGQTVIIQVADTTVRVIDQNGELITLWLYLMGDASGREH
jgi:hypothetical protein